MYTILQIQNIQMIYYIFQNLQYNIEHIAQNIVSHNAMHSTSPSISSLMSDSKIITVVVFKLLFDPTAKSKEILPQNLIKNKKATSKWKFNGNGRVYTAHYAETTSIGLSFEMQPNILNCGKKKNCDCCLPGTEVQNRVQGNVAGAGEMFFVLAHFY